MGITAKDYVYNTQAVSQKAYENHLTLYKGYVDKVNEIDNLLATDPREENANSTYSHFRGLKEAGTFAIDAVILHELYFDNLDNERGAPNLKMNDMLRRSFGGLNEWKEDFTACAKAARGWACLSFEQRTQSFRNVMLDSHNTGIIVASFPIIVLDMYEHAYFMDYGTKKGEYISNFIDYINWDVAAYRLAKIYNE